MCDLEFGVGKAFRQEPRPADSTTIVLRHLIGWNSPLEIPH